MQQLQNNLRDILCNKYTTEFLTTHATTKQQNLRQPMKQLHNRIRDNLYNIYTT
jgi:hypothetical protein